MQQNEKTFFSLRTVMPLEVAIRAEPQCCGNNVNTTFHKQHTYNVVLQLCEHVAAQYSTFGSSNVAATFPTLQNHNVVQRCNYVLCLLGWDLQRVTL